MFHSSFNNINCFSLQIVKGRLSLGHLLVNGIRGSKKNTPYAAQMLPRIVQRLHSNLGPEKGKSICEGSR
jgi:ribosomal protein S11